MNYTRLKGSFTGVFRKGFGWLVTSRTNPKKHNLDPKLAFTNWQHLSWVCAFNFCQNSPSKTNFMKVLLSMMYLNPASPTGTRVSSFSAGIQTKGQWRINYIPGTLGFWYQNIIVTEVSRLEEKNASRMKVLRQLNVIRPLTDKADKIKHPQQTHRWWGCHEKSDDCLELPSIFLIYRHKKDGRSALLPKDLGAFLLLYIMWLFSVVLLSVSERKESH